MFNFLFSFVSPIFVFINMILFKAQYFNALPKCNLGKYAKILPPYSISDASIGEYSYISRNSVISQTSIGKFCSIGPNFFCGWGIHPLNGISTSPLFYSKSPIFSITFSKEQKVGERKEIIIGNDVFIGANVIVLDGVTIGDGAVIGAGAVVSKDIPPYAVAVGNPIKIIKYRFDEHQISQLLKIKWWNMDMSAFETISEHFFDLDLLIATFSDENSQLE